jgi:hypothetical protein
VERLFALYPRNFIAAHEAAECHKPMVLDPAIRGGPERGYDLQRNG